MPPQFAIGLPHRWHARPDIQRLPGLHGLPGKDAGIDRNLFGSEGGALRTRRNAFAVGVIVGPFRHRLPPITTWDGVDHFLAERIIREQLQKAGVRLAHLLDAALGK